MSKDIQLSVLSNNNKLDFAVVFGYTFQPTYIKGYVLKVSYKGVPFIIGIVTYPSCFLLKLPGRLGIGKSYPCTASSILIELDKYLNKKGISTLDPLLIEELERSIRKYCNHKIGRLNRLAEYLKRMNNYLNASDKFKPNKVKELHFIFDDFLVK